MTKKVYLTNLDDNNILNTVSSSLYKFDHPDLFFSILEAIRQKSPEFPVENYLKEYVSNFTQKSMSYPHIVEYLNSYIKKTDFSTIKNLS